MSYGRPKKSTGTQSHKPSATASMADRLPFWARVTGTSVLHRIECSPRQSPLSKANSTRSEPETIAFSARGSGAGREDGQRGVGGVQRRRDCDHHYDHGAGDEGAAWRPSARFGAAATSVPQLCPELPLRRYLLEQPPSHAACQHGGERRDAMGQPAPLVLAIVVSVRHGMDGRNPFHRGAHCALRRGAVDGRDRILLAPADDHPRARPGFNPEKGDRSRLEGQAVAGALPRCDRCDAAFAVDRPGGLRGCGADLADSGPAYRKRAATQRSLT